MLNIKNKWGFTLVELMIVVSIIWVLAVTLLPQLQWAQARARDGWRIASLQNISAVLETYLWDVWLYPASLASSTDPAPASTVDNCISDGAWKVSDTLSKVFKWWKAPLNPQKTSLSWNCSVAWAYQYTALTKDWIKNSWYILVADVETPQKWNMDFSTACSSWDCKTALVADWSYEYNNVVLTWSLTAEIASSAKNSVYWVKN